MARILLGNQWGGGVGHVRNLRALADRLQLTGHEPVLALPDMVEARPAYAGVTYPVIQGPVWRGALRPRKQTRTFSDILANQAFADPRVFTSIAGGWQELIQLVKPDIIVVEYAPILALAARGKLPLISIGSPFCLPPGTGKAFPVLNPEAGPSFPEDQLLKLINEWLDKNDQPRLIHLPEIHPAEENYPIGLIEMDPYRAYRQSPILPPLKDSLPPPLAIKPPPGRARLFCYMVAHHKPGIRLLAILARNGLEITAYIKGVQPPLKKRLREDGVNVLEEHMPIREALGSNHLLLHNGSTLLSYEALAMGRAQLCFPMDLEKELNSRSLQALGVAKIVRQADAKPEAAELIKTICIDDAMHDNAEKMAAELASRNYPDPVDHIIDKIGVYL